MHLTALGISQNKTRTFTYEVLLLRVDGGLAQSLVFKNNTIKSVIYMY